MATAYYEIVVKGDDKLLKGFVRGFEIGRSVKGGLWYCADHPIDTKHLREILTFRGDHIHLICAGSARRSLVAAIKQAADLGFEILSDTKVARTHFGFEFRTFSRDVASAIKETLDNVPAELCLVDLEPRESVDSGARGAELYSPVHEYEFRGKGRIVGDFEKLLSFRTTLSTNEFFKVEHIVIER